jgi:hypothetical protein
LGTAARAWDAHGGWSEMERRRLWIEE